MLQSKKNIIYSLMGIFFLFGYCFGAALPAFPGAEGCGAYTTGGRGGRIIEVTNLNNSGLGSFRAACEASGKRTVVFRTGGTIKLNSMLRISNSNITIAGQTAPGDGICIANDMITVRADNVIMRYIRMRPGNNSGKNIDAIEIQDGKNIIVDHCSTSWGTDEVFSVVNDSRGEPGKVTVQWCIISEGLGYPSNGPTHGVAKSSLIRNCCGRQYSFHHNLYASTWERNPAVGNLSTTDRKGLYFDWRNNVVYNWGGGCGGHTAGAKGMVVINMVNNYYVQGNQGQPCMWQNLSLSLQSRYFISGNYMNKKKPEEQWSIVKLSKRLWERFRLEGPALFTGIPVTPEDGASSYERVLQNVGVSFPKRDAVDARIVRNVKNATGKLIADEEEVGGWPRLEPGAPPKDSDHDGMPDKWETARGLNPKDASDRNNTNLSKEGYTNVEVYINSLVSTPPIGINKNITPNSGSAEINISVEKIAQEGISFIATFPGQGHFIFIVYDVSGRKIFERTIVRQHSGSKKIRWDFGNKPESRVRNGVYVGIISSDKTRIGRKIVIVR